MDTKIKIFEIERFAINDGPGIRTTVFLQGCPLRCAWCANPESQTQGLHLLYNATKCVHCGRCAKACPNGAIEYLDQDIIIHREKCRGCKVCEAACMNEAIKFSGMEMTAEEIMEVVLRDKAYYESSGGGITLSGGEALCQESQAIALLTLAKEKGLHTAVETCGYMKKSTLEKAIDLVDVFLFDVKSTNAEKLLEQTGAKWDVIYENLSYIAQRDSKKLILRVPVIPDFNYRMEEINKIFDLAQEAGIQEVNLLPYHTLGAQKYQQLGREYPYPVKEPLTNADMEPFAEVGRSRGLTMKIGG